MVKLLINLFQKILKKFSNVFDAKIFQKYVDYLFILFEKIIINLDYFLPYYLNYYNDLVESEIKLADILSERKIVHIGSGSIPSTSILIAQKTNSRITCIDKDPKAIKNSIKIVKKIGLSNLINIKKINALDISFEKFDVIFISHGIVPKKEFLEKLSKKITDKNIVIHRSFSKDSNLEREDIFLHNLFDVIKVITHKKNGSVISIKLRKK